MVAIEILCLQSFGCKAFVPTAAAWAWLLWGPLSVVWLRMWLGCKAAQGWDFHDSLIKIKTEVTEHFGNITVTPVRGASTQLLWQLSWRAVWAISSTIPVKTWVWGSDPALLPLLAASIPTLPSLLSPNTAVKTSKSATGHSDFPGKGTFSWSLYTFPVSQDLSCGCWGCSACEPCLWSSCSATGAELWAFLHILQQTVAKHPQMTLNTCASGWGCPMLSAAGRMRLWSARNSSTALTASTAGTTPRPFPPGTARFAGFSPLLAGFLQAGGRCKQWEHEILSG